MRVGVLCHWLAGLELPRARGPSSEAQLIMNSLHPDVLHTEPSPPWDDHSWGGEVTTGGQVTVPTCHARLPG